MNTCTQHTATSATRPPHEERRRNKRFRIARDGKVFLPGPRQYLAAQTRDLSVGGALLEVETDRPLATGDAVQVAVASTDSPLVRDDALVHAVVVRAESLGARRQAVAVRYTGARAAARAA